MEWVRPSGTVCTTNDNQETKAYCESLGWKPNKAASQDETVTKPKQRGRPPKHGNSSTGN